ncbi:acetaldehyde dehydrogenase [Cetobacterium ceti]|uniref:Acetaldehyde dehydrogenase n=1 Tax=Cetobacterium ceti TaxID=180163 RepID=A0A1T4MCA0_9FUSO|nr:acetaldehyde dehydrogenase (acetylating) [Cetobacterium ceti]SJZ64506.1 acetaldehyde dehydrogenase [Cetobacterium ceti]
MDKDLLSIQQVRDLVKKSKEAQKIYSEFSQEKIDKIVYEVSMEIRKYNEKLAKMAAEETGFGKWEDKVIKNKFASEGVYEYIKNMKTVGILKEENKVMEVGVPVGVIAGLIPSTNPTSTTIYKTLISLKSGNGIVVSPHPNAKKSIIETAKLLQEAATKAGAPEGLIGVIEIPSMEGTTALMKHKDIALILATGGEAMVKAAYSSGNPAIGVGPGNGPAFIERSADIKLAVKRILDSKTFDNGVICASEQSIIVEEIIKNDVVRELKNQGGYFLTREESGKLGKFILRANGTMNPQIVGKSPQVIADLAGITIPTGTRVLISEENTVSKTNPYSREKLAPILGFYVEKDWESACERSMEILYNEGKGHTLVLHTRNKDVIKAFALKKPVSRLLVNTPGALGGIGGSTNLAPALTLGCGAVGGSSTSDNITPMNLINIRRVACGVKEIEDIRPVKKSTSVELNGVEIEALIKKVLGEILKG